MNSEDERATQEKTEQPINVYVRIRPFNEEETEKKCTSCIDVINKTEIQIRQLYSRKSFRFERVFDAFTSQKEVFDKTANPLVLEVLKGYNCTVFAYGQTGSGKTHTVIGGERENMGLIPQAVDMLFEILQQNEIESNIRVSFLELYNEELFDLLSMENSKTIRLYDDKKCKGSVIVQGLEEMTVNTKDEIYRYLEMGYERRQTAATLMNSQSSRSHCIFTIIVHMRELSLTGEDLVKTGKLNLVDLAGSENIGRSGSLEKRAREAGNINQSLLTLGRVIRALTEKSCHIPYRESKLTRILRDSLGGSAKTSLIATISSANINAEETASTLEYAMRVRNIQNRPEINHNLSRSSLIHQYKQEIERLKKDLNACRKGTGICLNKENYLQMMNEQEYLKSDLNVKTSRLTSLEQELKEVTAKLDILQKSWADAANNIETLTQQQRILEENLVLCKEEKDKQKEELENVKTKHDQLTTDSEKLASVVEVQYKNEEILHRKLSSLYDVSHRNKISARDFCDSYNKLCQAMKTELDSCVNYIHNVMNLGSESGIALKTMLSETYSALKQLMTSLILSWNALERNKDEYFCMKDAFLSEVCDCIEKLEQIIEATFTAISKVVRKIIHESLGSTENTIQAINENHKCYYNTLVDSLNNITAGITQSSNQVADLLGQTQRNAISKFEIMKGLNQEILSNINSQASRAREAKEDISAGFSAIRSQILALKEKHSKSVAQTKKYSEEFVNLHTRRQQKSDNLQTYLNESINKIRDETNWYSNQLSASVNQQMETVKDIEKKGSSMCEKAKKEIDATTAKLSEQKEQSNMLLNNFKQSFATFGSGLSDCNQKYDSYMTTLTELCHSTTENANASAKLVDDMYQKISNINSRVLKDLGDANSKVSRTNEYLQENYGQMRKMIHELSDVKLKCPTHGGDTPQRSQDDLNLISNLNINTP